MFSEAELERLRRFPREISQEELVRFFTLTPADLGFIQAHRGTGNRLGLAVQLCGHEDPGRSRRARCATAAGRAGPPGFPARH
ncbi:MAG: DUF4158 domain-containing protein [Candidatus Dormibacteraeota bacterium]|nr:DUF4158 domain-containing protein [Candidatus Dormibacteraeota bacterium]MDQ6920150.1 DUF4158 domain-containing protein [Candidatus Dormibacteraeota bacterium]